MELFEGQRRGNKSVACTETLAAFNLRKTCMAAPRVEVNTNISYLVPAKIILLDIAVDT